MSYVGIIITFVFASNVVLMQFLGICPFVKVSGSVAYAVETGFAVTFTMSIASLVTWAVQTLILVPLGITFLQTVAFILVVIGLVQVLEKLVHTIASPLVDAMGIDVTLLATNCAVLGIALIAVRSGYGAMESLVAGFSGGLGYTLAILLMATIREKLDTEWVPAPLRGVPITFIAAGLMAMAFMALDRALLSNFSG